MEVLKTVKHLSIHEGVVTVGLGFENKTVEASVLQTTQTCTRQIRTAFMCWKVTTQMLTLNWGRHFLLVLVFCFIVNMAHVILSWCNCLVVYWIRLMTFLQHFYSSHQHLVKVCLWVCVSGPFTVFCQCLVKVSHTIFWVFLLLLYSGRSQSDSLSSPG